MRTIEAIYARRAVRSYSSNPLSEAEVKELIDAAIQAPSAINNQPWAFAVVQDPEVLQTISDRAIELMKEQALPPGLHTMIDQPGWNIFYNCSTLIIICSKPEGAHPDWDCCFAAENLMLAAREKGWGSCIIGFAWAALADSGIRKLLNIPEEYEAVTPIIVGETPSFPPPTERRSPEILCWRSSANCNEVPS